VIFLEADDTLAEAADLLLAFFVVNVELLIVDYSGLLLQLLIDLLEFLVLLLQLGEVDLVLVEVIVDDLEL